MGKLFGAMIMYKCYRQLCRPNLWLISFPLKFGKAVFKTVFPVCVVPAHCLHTVTEDNPELLCSMNTAVLGALEKVLLSSQPGMAPTLLRTLAAGTVCHLSRLFLVSKLFKTVTCHSTRVERDINKSPLWTEVADRFKEQTQRLINVVTLPLRISRSKS